MIEVGTRVQFVPHYMKDDRYNKNVDLRPNPVMGTVFQVNRNGVFFVEYIASGVTLRTAFLPVDIGKNVRILK